MITRQKPLIAHHIIHAAVGIIFDKEGRLLVDCRPAHWEKSGYWEFPGGKIEPQETAQQALIRELREEIGIAVQQCKLFLKTTFQLPHRHIVLHAWQVMQFSGEAQSLEGQELRWITLAELPALKMLESNQQIIEKILKEFS